ncbi:hypothetical protein Tco_1294831 [Tanacetum coccineum]
MGVVRRWCRWFGGGVLTEMKMMLTRMMVVGVGYGEGSRDGEDGCGDEMMMTTIMGWQRGVVVVRRGCDCSSGCGTRLRGRRWWIWWRGGVEVIRMVSAGG